MTDSSASHAPTWMLCVATARHAARLADADEVAHAARDVDDWDAAIALASEQGLLPWLARSLPLADYPGVRAAAAAQAARSLTLVQHLVLILDALRDAGVAALAYKGPFLSLQLYGDLALRHSTDLDIVVSKRDYPRARAVLVARGLAPRHPHSTRREQALFGWLGHASFGRGDPFVELHWRFAQRAFPFLLTVEEARARGSTVMVAGAPRPVMAQDDLLVTLSMHGMRHLYERLEWLAGVARLVHATQPDDIDAVIARAAALRARRLLLASVAIAARALGLRIHERWQLAFADDLHVTDIATALTDALAARALGGAAAPEGGALQAFYSQLMDSPGDRARLLLRGVILPTEREWEAVRLPDALTSLYYVIRPVRLGAASLMRIVRS